MNIDCIICGTNFNLNSKEKKRAGGKRNHCPDCSNETEPKALGFANGDGKMAAISILKFKTQADAERYRQFFQANSGLHKGKSCQLGRGLMADPGISFKTISQAASTNHKGKAT